MPTRDTLGGIVHTYQRYDPTRIPPPRPPETDLLSAAMEHLLEFGDLAGEAVHFEKRLVGLLLDAGRQRLAGLGLAERFLGDGLDGVDGGFEIRLDLLRQLFSCLAHCVVLSGQRVD